MLNRSINNGVSDNPLVDSPFVDQYDFGTGGAPVPSNQMLFLDGTMMLYVDNSDMDYLGA